MRRPTFSRTQSLGSAIAAISLCAAATWRTAADPIIPSPNTTVLTEPVRSDGTIDYIAALNQRGLERTKNENAFFAMDALLHDAAYPSRDYREAIYEVLGRQVPSEPEGPKLLMPKENLPSNYWNAISGPWTAVEFPELASWLDVRDEAMDQFVQAGSASAYFFPCVNIDVEYELLMQALLPNLWQIRQLARNLQLRALRSIDSTDFESAWDDTVGILNWSRLITAGDPPLIQYLVGISLNALAYSLTSDLLGCLQPSDLELAGQMHHDLRAFEEPDAILSSINTHDRFMMLDIVAQFVVGNLDMDDLVTISSSFSLSESDRESPPNSSDYLSLQEIAGFDPNVALGYINSWFDRIDDSADQSNWPRSIDNLESFESEVRDPDPMAPMLSPQEFTRAHVDPEHHDPAFLTNHLGSLVVRLFLPRLTSTALWGFQTQAIHRMTLTGIGLCQYRLTHGELPESLDALKEDHPDLDLIDPFTDGEQWRYQIHDDGFTIYSVNTDLDDDGGRSFEDRENRVDDDDRGDLIFSVKFRN